jgi:outer membrane lipoprotein SlyB
VNKVKKFLALCIAVLFVISVAGLAFADVKGTVTKIEGMKISVKDDKGKETTEEVKDTAGAKVGDQVEIKAGAVKIMKPAEKKPAAGGY